METQIATTPFGQRPASLAQIATQIKLRDALEAACAPGSNAPSAINKWHMFRTLTAIRDRLGLSDRALSVLNALLSFHPETALTLDEEGQASGSLVVYPSNRQLSQRAHGMAEVTIRRHIAALIGAGLIVRRDSPNGKRYVRRDGEGGRGVVFGFDLAPLVVRSIEFDAMADAARREHRDLQVVKERISLRRRDIQKWLTLALDEGLAGDWEGFRRRFLDLLMPLRTLRSSAAAFAAENDLARLHQEIAKGLESLVYSQNLDGNDDQSDRHMSNSKTEANIDIEPASERGGGDVRTQLSRDIGERAGTAASLGLLLEACPDLKEWSDGKIVDWGAVSTTAERVRPMLGISVDAWGEAKRVLGVREADIALGFILQRSEHSSEAVTSCNGERTVNGSPAIRSAGGYLRSLTEQARVGQLALGALLMALIGQRLKQKKRGD